MLLFCRLISVRMTTTIRNTLKNLAFKIVRRSSNLSFSPSSLAFQELFGLIVFKTIYYSYLRSIKLQPPILLMMSTEPLLPSYTSATGQCPHRQDTRRVTTASEDIDYATPVIQTLGAFIFTGNAIVSTIWASRSNTAPKPVGFPFGPPYTHHLLSFSTYIF